MVGVSTGVSVGDKVQVGVEVTVGVKVKVLVAVGLGVGDKGSPYQETQIFQETCNKDVDAPSNCFSISSKLFSPRLILTEVGETLPPTTESVSKS